LQNAPPHFSSPRAPPVRLADFATRISVDH
jgi:hypothetical protein